MSMKDVLAEGQRIVARFQKDTGILCALRVLTFDETSGTRSPDYTFAARDVPFNIASLASITDPSTISRVRAMNVDQTRYRLLTCPAGVIKVAVQKDDRILKEPAIVGQSDTYQVIEAMSPDESSTLELVFHCQKL